MSKKDKIGILIICILIIILGIIAFLCLKTDNKNSKQFDMNNMSKNTEQSKNVETASTTSTETISTTTEVCSSLTENLELHATYYLEECYVETNQLVKAGENILQYTNGTYLTAPYDCIITNINIPEESEKCTNEHYIEICSNNNLMVQFKVDETKINNISLGQSATIQISAFDDKVLYGVVTNISSTASNGKFTVTVEFENDGDIKIGMTAIVKI